MDAAFFQRGILQLLTARDCGYAIGKTSAGRAEHAPRRGAASRPHAQDAGPCRGGAATRPPVTAGVGRSVTSVYRSLVHSAARTLTEYPAAPAAATEQK
jgi:hypothetical protein